MNDEIWRDVKGYEGLYQVSNTGRVKSLERYVQNHGGLYHKREKILKHGLCNGKHYMVILCKNGTTKPFLVHRLVAMAFIPNPENKDVVDHIDTNPSNNHVDNLRWVTQKENCNNPLTRKHGSEAKMGHAYWGKPFTDEARKKMSEKAKGRVFSEEHKEKLRIARRNYLARKKGVAI